MGDKDIQVYDRLRDLVEATQKQKPKPTDIAELKRLLDEHPDVWRAVDLARNATLRVIGKRLQVKVTCPPLKFLFFTCLSRELLLSVSSLPPFPRFPTPFQVFHTIRMDSSLVSVAIPLFIS